MKDAVSILEFAYFGLCVWRLDILFQSITTCHSSSLSVSSPYWFTYGITNSKSSFHLLHPVAIFIAGCKTLILLNNIKSRLLSSKKILNANVFYWAIHNVFTKETSIKFRVSVYRSKCKYVCRQILQNNEIPTEAKIQSSRQPAAITVNQLNGSQLNTGIAPKACNQAPTLTICSVCSLLTVIHWER